MSDWIAQHFLHPSYVLPWGIALAAVPVIVHLINRLRYRRVRFAAMEFLLKSQQRNRRRLMIEQLILLLLRIAIVAGLLVLISRLVLDPSRPVGLPRWKIASRCALGRQRLDARSLG